MDRCTVACATREIRNDQDEKGPSSGGWAATCQYQRDSRGLNRFGGRQAKMKNSDGLKKYS
jgi:hypothetical protein